MCVASQMTPDCPYPDAVRLALVAASVAVLLSACSAPATPPPAVATSSVAGTPTASPTPAVPPDITLAFAGDVHFTERTLKLLDNPATAFGPISSILSAADVAMVNLETAVTTRGTPEPKEFHFRAPATAFDAVKAAGVDAVSLANNHTLDYGQVGLLDTLDAAKAAGVPTVGAGVNTAAAYAPWITTVKGVRIAVLGFSQVTELASTWAVQDNRPGLALAFDVPKAVAAVQAAKAQADVVVVFMHWGQEYNSCPIDVQKSFAAAMAGAGANIIVGVHAHVLQGDGWLGQTYVAYGMSNFVWWYNDAATNDTGVVEVKLHGTKIASTQFLPAYIDRTTGQPIPSTGAEADRITAERAALRPCTGLADQPS
jgi:poly-gamma-glutamate synthesis protein (capsule biosynthesis protein)